MSALPSVSRWRICGDVLAGRISGNAMFDYLRSTWREFGRPPAFALPIPGNHLTVVTKPELALEFLRTEWKYPRGSAEMWPFLDFYGKHSMTAGKAMPFMLAQGEEWRQPRHTFQAEIFSSSKADLYVPLMDEVCVDAFSLVRSGNSPFLTDSGVLNYTEFVSNLAFEMLANILLGKRLGLMDGSASQTSKDFVNAAQLGFADIGTFSQVPPAIGKLTRGYKRFIPNMQRMERLAHELIAGASPNSVLGRLQAGGKISEDSMIANFVTLLQAGVDTTSSTMQFHGYHLATDLRAQAALRAEFRDHPTTSVKRLPYWKAFVREVHRVNPTGPGFTRKNPDGDKLISCESENFLFQKDSQMLYSNSFCGMEPDHLHGDVAQFLPERWLHENVEAGDVVCTVDVAGVTTEVRKPAAVLWHALNWGPFSVGPRMCVGARLADRELGAVARQLLQFERVELADPKYDLTTVVGIVPMPRDPILLQLS